jgi:hypothetical protein
MEDVVANDDCRYLAEERRHIRNGPRYPTSLGHDLQEYFVDYGAESPSGSNGIEQKWGLDTCGDRVP